MSKYLNGPAARGFLRAGDAFLPGDETLPPFSATASLDEVDRILDYLPPRDRKGLVALFGIFGWLPRFALRALGRAIALRKGASMRLLDLGLTGVYYTLYYADPNVLKRIGWDANVERPGVDGDDASGSTAFVMARARAGAARLRQIPVEKRVHYVRKLREVVLRREAEILDAVQKETRKCRTDALVSDLFSALDHFVYLEKRSARILEDRKAPTPLSLMGKTSLVSFEPLGVVLMISPWNYPFYQCVVPVTSAFVAGNAVVYKPSEYTPLTGLMEKLFFEAQFDPDWVQIVYGDGKTGSELVAARPDKVFFTGSVATGQKVMAQAAEHLIPVELELGGKDPLIVFEDANLERATAGALWGALTNLGQSCTSVERVYVQDSIYDAFRDLLLQKVAALTQGVDTDGSTDLGEMTTDFQVKIVDRQLRRARDQGALFRSGASSATSRRIDPVVVEDAPDESDLMREETFGPVIPLGRFRTEAEVVARANDSPYGLSASVWTRDLARARRVAKALVTGNVSINNVMVTEGNPALPFGGVKASGFGRYKGEFGLYSFSNVKSLIVDKDSGKIEANWFPYTAEKFQLFRRLMHALFHPRGVRWLSFLPAGLKLESLSQRLGRRRSREPRQAREAREPNE